MITDLRLRQPCSPMSRAHAHPAPRPATLSDAKKLLLTVLLALCLAFPAVGHSNDFPSGQTAPEDSAATVAAAIKALLTARVGYEADEVHVEMESALSRLSDCDSAAPFLPRDDTPLWGRITIAVTCDGASSPHYLQVRVIAIGSYVSAATAIDAGTVIEPWMLKLSQGDLGELPARALRLPDDAVGQEARQRLREGAPVQAHQLRAPYLVTRGQMVAIEAQGRGFSINRDGEALDSGGRGDSVRVRISRQQTVTATVVGTGRVSVTQ